MGRGLFHRSDRARAGLRLGIVAAVLSLLVAVCGLAVVAVVPADAVPSDPFDRAAQSGDRVEVVGSRSDTDTVWANPDGTITRDISAAPIRTRGSDGSWRSIDHTLEVAGDGSVRPVAAPGRVVLSGGGKAPLVSSELDGVRISYSWPGVLPKPVLKEDTATYRDVFDGVDLVMSATDAGPKQVLVVKNRAAAQNPKLRSLSLPLHVSGGSVVPVAGGDLSVRDGFGREVAVSPKPMMWDSSSTTSDGAAARRAGPDPSGTASAAERVEGPADGDRIDAIPTTMKDHAIVLEPDADALVGEAVTYPVYVDPTVSATRNSWAMVFKQYPTTRFYKWTDSNGQGVGYQNYNGASTKRLFWKFNTPSGLAGAHVYHAEFKAKEVWSSSCTKTPVKLERTSHITSHTTWNNQPSWSTDQDTVTDAAGFPGCSGSKWLEFNATQAAQSVANSGYGNFTLGMRAKHESDPRSWKRFTYGAVFSVKYSHAPNTPSSLGVSNPYAACGDVIGAGNPQLHAKLSDRDSSDSVRPQWQVFAGTSISGSPIWSETGAFRKPGSTPYTTSVGVPLPTDADGDELSGSYTWRVRATDNSNNGSSTGLSGPWSSSCTFTVDTDAPSQPEIISPSDGHVWKKYPEIEEVTVGSTDDDVKYFAWSMNSDEPTSEGLSWADSDGQATFSAWTEKAGSNVLRVWGYDGAFNSSGPAQMRFEAEGLGATSTYSLDEGSGATAADSTGDQPLSIGTAQWSSIGWYYGDAGPVHDFGLGFEGSQASTTSDAAVDTTDSFTVSGWFDPADVASSAYGLSTDGTGQSAFRLGVKTDCAITDEQGQPLTLPTCYAFGVLDAESGQYRTAYSRAQADAESGLVHLIGTYVASSGEVTLWMFDDEGGEPTSYPRPAAQTVTSPASSGPLRVGSARDGTTVVGGWTGIVDQLLVAQGTLDETGRSKLHAERAGRIYCETEECS